MANILLSDAEKTFILHGVEDDLRCDGRTRSDYRPIEIETGLVTHANGSCRLRLANTDVLVAVKSEIDIPHMDKPDEGKITFFVDCSANAAPEFEGRGGEELAMEFSSTLQGAYRSRQAFNLKNLSILAGHRCWKLYVDVLILECGGNLYDAVSLAVKGALFNTRLPKVTAAVMDGGSVDLTLSEDPYDFVKLDVDTVPILITICKIGEHCIVDPSAEEEVCSSASLVVGVARRSETTYFSNIRTSGAGSFHIETLSKCMDLGKAAGFCLDAELLRLLNEEEKQVNTKLGRREIFGFLK